MFRDQKAGDWDRVVRSSRTVISSARGPQHGDRERDGVPRAVAKQQS